MEQLLYNVKSHVARAVREAGEINGGHSDTTSEIRTKRELFFDKK